ncbi:MAG: cell division protein FtsZ [Chloroflexota bacterium]|nr:cell division protein FtsZ [Chloroflexota bacterium]
MPPSDRGGFDPDRLDDLQRPGNLVPRILRQDPDPGSSDSAPGLTDIRVIGIGGAGNNAVNRMVAAELEGVEFVAVNTDAQDLTASNAHRRLLIGSRATDHLGSGGDPRLGERAATESSDELADLVDGADMVFITAGMGGGTGTGATPILADRAMEAGALTVAVVTVPFTFEGSRRVQVARHGLAELESRVDALITLHNNKLLEHASAGTAFADAFQMADEMLHRGVQGVTDLITSTGLVNVDFADVRSVMRDSGTAMMGVGEAAGEERALRAVRQAMESPLLDTSIDDARGVLINITASDDVAIAEINAAAEHVTAVAAPDANIIFGTVVDPRMGQSIRVTLIATGFQAASATEAARSGRSQHRSSGRGPMAGTRRDRGASLADDEVDVPDFLRRRSPS